MPISHSASDPMPAQHSQDEIDAIRRLIIAGYSRGQIAAQLGLTKNTVSGLAHRHIEKAIKGRSVSIGKPRRKKVGRPKLAAIAPTAEVIPIVAEERPTLWVDLGAGQCTWTIAGSGAPGNGLLWRRSGGFGTSSLLPAPPHDGRQRRAAFIIRTMLPTVTTSASTLNAAASASSSANLSATGNVMTAAR